MTGRPAAVSDRTLELFALGELAGGEAAALEERLRGDAELAARLAALEASNREILDRHPPAAVAAEVRHRAAARTATPRRSRRGPILLLAGPALAGALALALWIRPGAEESSDRLKGATPQLLALAIRGGETQRLPDGAAVAPGETIQLAYQSAGLPYGVIVSVDARAAVTLHWPEERRRPAELQAHGPVALPHAFQLDESPGFERFFLVAAAEPVDVSQVMEAARVVVPGRPLRLPTTWFQTSILLHKQLQRHISP